MNEQQWADFLRDTEREERAQEERRGELLVAALFLFAVAVILIVSALN